MTGCVIADTTNPAATPDTATDVKESLVGMPFEPDDHWDLRIG
eukprot:CAMPEP_0178888664 /NCGR_PEP_ID=MMETSP0747-20121128/17301_2 /TAXON_ID=913974 /ORGANISM="Nitzschia punctata, Strain CCMP561" /LENGTH=42 /DNA_ID= /DNA_START= /DNA_END= /DNA_ORIENTATION=